MRRMRCQLCVRTVNELTPFVVILSAIHRYAPNGGKVVKLLVGNKCDLVNDRAVSTREGEAWARSKGMLFLEASAKSDENVRAAFEEVVAKILDTPSLVAGTGPAASRPGASTRVDVAKPAVAQASGGGGCCG